MKSLNKTIGALAVAALLTVGGTSVAFAAQEDGRQGGLDLEPIFTELSITAEQQAQVEGVLESLREQGRGPRDDSGTRPTREEHEARMQEQKEALENELNTILSYDQTVDFMAYLDANRPDGERQERK